MPENKNNHNNKNGGGKNDTKDAAVTISKEEYDQLTAKAAERDIFNDKYVRAHAEFENARKRYEKDKVDFARYMNEAVIISLLPIIDNLEIAEAHIKEAKDFKAVRDGVDMIQQQIQGFVKDMGLERIDTIGGKFDPHMHEPVETVEAADKEDGVIVAELKPGYSLNGKLLRPASVKIVQNKTK